MYPCFISLLSLQIISTQRQEVDQGMEVLLSSNHQTEFCENVLEKLMINDAKSLVFFTRSECVETSRNLLKIFSPLIDELSSSRSQEAAQEPLTLVLPDTDVATVRVMLALLSRGEMPAHTELTHLKNVMRDVISLAACLGLDLNINVDSPPPPPAPDDEINRGSLLKIRSLNELLEPKLDELYKVENNKEDLAEPTEYVEYDDMIDSSQLKVEDLPNRIVIDVPTGSGRRERSFLTLNKKEKQHELKSQKSKVRTKFKKNLTIGEQVSLEQKWKRAQKKRRMEPDLDHLRPDALLSGIHDKEWVEWVECRQCGKTFGSDASLRNHERSTKHNVVFPNAKKSVYGGSLLRCNTCSRSFKTVKERVKHELKEHKSM